MAWFLFSRLSLMGTTRCLPFQYCLECTAVLEKLKDCLVYILRWYVHIILEVIIPDFAPQFLFSAHLYGLHAVKLQLFLQVFRFFCA